MKLHVLLSILVLALAISGCNLPSNIPTATPTPTLFIPSATQSLSTSTPTLTPLPSNTAPPTTTSTPTVPVAFPKDVAVNCRLGPGIGWIALSGLSVGTSSQISGKSGDGGWWYITDPLNSGRKCWVAASVTNTSGNLANIPVVAAPNAIVTDVSIDLEPDTISVAGCVGPIQPIEIGGSIETNGPVEVKWHFETEQNGAMSTQTTEFETFGTQDFSVDYTPALAAGDYWVRLIVTSPNSMQAEAEYTITCP